MQRIGRVDRRLNPDIEARLVADHPDAAPLRGRIAFWNFLPPDELDRLLRLFGRVTHKTLRISKTFGIEGKKLLTPEDDYEALKDFTHAYEGDTTPLEEMHLEYQRLLKDHPDLADRLAAMPSKVFSGKAHPAPGTQAVFFCYALPAPLRPPAGAAADAPVEWSADAGDTKWYLFDLATEKIADDPTRIIELVRSIPDTLRKHDIPNPTLSDIRAKVERHLANTYLKAVQAPAGVKPVLKAWLELS